MSPSDISVLPANSDNRQRDRLARVFSGALMLGIPFITGCSPKPIVVNVTSNPGEDLEGQSSGEAFDPTNAENEAVRELKDRLNAMEQRLEEVNSEASQAYARGLRDGMGTSESGESIEEEVEAVAAAGQRLLEAERKLKEVEVELETLEVDVSSITNEDNRRACYELGVSPEHCDEGNIIFTILSRIPQGKPWEKDLTVFSSDHPDAYIWIANALGTIIHNSKNPEIVRQALNLNDSIIERGKRAMAEEGRE